MEHKHFYTFAVMLFYIQMKAGSSKKQCNNDVIRELIQTLEGNASLDAINAPTKMAQPFTAIQLANKHVRLCDFLDLCQEICKKEKPEVVTIITVKKYYDDKSDTSGDSFMPTFISAIQNYFVFGNNREICNNPSLVTVHIVDSALFSKYDAMDSNQAIEWIVYKHVNTIAIKYVNKIFADFIYNSLMSEVKSCIVKASYDFFESITKKDDFWKLTLAKSPYEAFAECIEKNYRYKESNVYLMSKFIDYKKIDPSVKVLVKNIRVFSEKIKMTTGIDVYVNSERVFGTVSNALFRFAMCNVYFGIKQKLFRNVLKYDYCADLSNLMSETFDILAKVLQSELANDFFFGRHDDLLLDCVDNRCDQEQLSMFYKQLFKNHDIKKIISDEIAKSDLLTKTKLNNDLYTANSTKIILNKELSKEMLPSLCQALQEIKIFERFDTQQNVYINFDKPDKNLIRNATYMLETKGKLRTITDPSNLSNKHPPYEYIITSLNTHDNENVISRVPLHLSFDSDTKIKKQKIETSSINLLQNTSFIKVDKFVKSDYHGSISRQATYYIDNAILSVKRKIVGVYKISKINDFGCKNGEEIVIIHHRNIKGQNDEKVSIIYKTAIEKSQKQIDTYGETTKKFKYFYNVPRSLLVSVKEQAELLQFTPARFTIPNHFESDDTDYYYKTVTTKLKGKCDAYSSLNRLSESFYKIKENVDYYSVSTNEFFGHINWTYDLVSSHSEKSYRFIKLEELRYIVDKCFVKECSKYGMVNAANIFYRQLYEEQWIYIFFAKLDDQRTIVNFVKNHDVIIYNSTRFNVADRILHLIYKDESVRVAEKYIRSLHPLRDFNRKNLTSLISDVLKNYSGDLNFTTSKEVYSYIEGKIRILLGDCFNCVINEKNSETTNNISQPRTLKSLALYQATHKFIKLLTKRTIKIIYEYDEYFDATLATVLVNRKMRCQESSGPEVFDFDLQSTDELLNLLENHSSRFITEMQNFES